mgnify:CR=1 FL=1
MLETLRRVALFVGIGVSVLVIYVTSRAQLFASGEISRQVFWYYLLGGVPLLSVASIVVFRRDKKTEESFDLAFSIGVMHHDKNTRTVFDAVSKMVKPGGRMAVWLYRKNIWPQEVVNNFLRQRTTRWKPERLEPWCRFGAFLGGIPLVKQTLSKVANFSTYPVRENRICDTFDWYAPEFQYHHTTAELESWFTEAGFDGLQVLPPERTGAFYLWAWRNNLIIGSGVNVVGRKKSA